MSVIIRSVPQSRVAFRVSYTCLLEMANSSADQSANRAIREYLDHILSASSLYLDAQQRQQLKVAADNLGLTDLSFIFPAMLPEHPTPVNGSGNTTETIDKLTTMPARQIELVLREVAKRRTTATSNALNKAADLMKERADMVKTGA